MAAADLAVDENQCGTIGSTTGLVVEWPICKFGGRSGDDVGTRNMRLVLIIGSPIDYMLRATSSQLAVNRGVGSQLGWIAAIRIVHYQLGYIAGDDSAIDPNYAVRSLTS